MVGAPEGVPGEQLLKIYQNSGLVEFAELDQRVQLAALFPNDPWFLDGTLWGLNNAGQDGGAPNADIDAPEGWTAARWATNIIVAVIDTGIRHTHEDLAANIWIDPMDGSHGTNAVNGSTNTADDNGHGTRIAGVIGAIGNNGKGIVGVAWGVKLMACKFADQFGNGSLSDALACLEHARNKGAHIINVSWGLDDFSPSLSNAIVALRVQGILLVAAAGNHGRSTDLSPHYPASYDLDNVIAVTASTRNDQLYPLSNIGLVSVDLMAPGEEVYTTDFLSDTSYVLDQGTSIAAGWVSGAAALLRAQYPAETPAQIISRLLNSVDVLPGLETSCVSGGRLNLRKALQVELLPPSLKANRAGGELVVALSGNPGRAYVFEASTNLASWFPLTTNLSDLKGICSLTNSFLPEAGGAFLSGAPGGESSISAIVMFTHRAETGLDGLNMTIGEGNSAALVVAAADETVS